jgi:hypothetical protein
MSGLGANPSVQRAAMVEELSAQVGISFPATTGPSTYF